MHTLSWNPKYFKDGMGFLGYSFQSDGDACWSGMGWKPEQFMEIESLIGSETFALLSSGERVEVTDEQMREIHLLWSDLRYKKYRSIYIPRDADMTHVKVIYEALESRSAVMLEYKEGYEMYPSEEDEQDGASVSSNGLIHIAYIGKSTGVRPVPLHLTGQRSIGGSTFMFAGLKSVKLIEGCGR